LPVENLQRGGKGKTRESRFFEKGGGEEGEGEGGTNLWKILTGVEKRKKKKKKKKQ